MSGYTIVGWYKVIVHASTVPGQYRCSTPVPPDFASYSASTILGQVTCPECLSELIHTFPYPIADVYRRCIELSGGVVHVENHTMKSRYTWCEALYPGTDNWRDTTCGHCYTAGVLGSFFVETRAKRSDRFPGKCPRCSAPAYVGFSAIECSKGCR